MPDTLGAASCPSLPPWKSPRLRDEIRHHDCLVLRRGGAGDQRPGYDRLLERLKGLEAAHPELVTPDSPTQRIGDQPVSELPQVEHRVPMLSIENTYSVDDLKKFGERTAKLPARRADRMGGGAEGRRRGRLAGLRRRPAGPGHHAGQRPRRRRRDPQHPHHPRRAVAAARQEASPASWSRGAKST